MPGVVPRRRGLGVTAGIVAIVFGATLVFFLFPNRDQEKLLSQCHREDAERGVREPGV